MRGLFDVQGHLWDEYYRLCKRVSDQFSDKSNFGPLFNVTEGLESV